MWRRRGSTRDPAPAWAGPTALDTPAVFRELEGFRLWHLKRLRGRRGGEYRGPARGESNEFREYRPYVPGDDFRHIDWGLFIRLDRVFVKTYRDEEYRFVHLLLDRSRSMASGGRAKFAVARDLALALAHLALSGEDRAVVDLLPLAPGRSAAIGTPLRGTAATARLRSTLAGLRPRGTYRADRDLAEHAARHRRREGLAILISDLLVPPEELAAGLQALVRRRFAAAVIEVRDPADEAFPAAASLVRAVDVETSEARLFTVDADNRRRFAEAAAAHRSAVDSLAERLGIPIFRHRTSERPEEFLLRSLPGLGLLRARRRC